MGFRGLDLQPRMGGIPYGQPIVKRQNALQQRRLFLGDPRWARTFTRGAVLSVRGPIACALSVPERPRGP